VRLDRSVNGFDKAEALAAASSLRDWVRVEREKRMSALLEKHRWKRKYWLFGPRIRRTDEQAAFWCDYWDMAFARHAYGQALDVADYVIEVCRVSGEPLVFLGRDEFQHLISTWPVTHDKLVKEALR
jgi:hypothetical protein